MENSRKIVRQIVYNFIPCLLRAEWPGRPASRLSSEGAYNSWRRSSYLKIVNRYNEIELRWVEQE